MAYLTKNGYLEEVLRHHPLFPPLPSKDGYPKIKVLQHRRIMAEHLGRSLLASEVVHHKNGNKMDNRIENLELTDRPSHQRQHRLGVARGPHSPQWRENIRRARIGTTASATTRAKMSRSQRESYAKTSRAAEQAERSRRMWADPEFRAKMSASAARAWDRRKQKEHQ